jgi:acetoacetate decarboxylase
MTSIYRMPLGFGPAPGPRQQADGIATDANDVQTLTASITATVDPRKLTGIVPAPFRLAGSTMTVGLHRLRNIGWLGGRGYNIVDIRIPTSIDTRTGRIEGDYVAVLWENRADPIMTGREELGFAKLYAEIEDPCPDLPEQSIAARTSWDGRTFLNIDIDNISRDTDRGLDSDNPPSAARPRFHYKYIPSTGQWGSADVAQPIMTPGLDTARRLQGSWSGEGRFRFTPATFQELPTMLHVVNALADITVQEFISTRITLSSGGKSLRDQTPLDLADHN